jgi:hypothetical protein
VFILDPYQGTAYKESGRTWTAKDIGITERRCAWMQNGFMSVNTTLGAGKAFLRSLYQQYAEWGVDFGKLAVISRNFSGWYTIVVASIINCDLTYN